MTSVMALDLGTHTGHALGDSLDTMVSGVRSFALKDGDVPGIRWVRFSNWLEATALAANVSLIVYEDILGQRVKSRQQAYLSANFCGRVEEIGAEYGIRVQAVGNTTLKKWVAGNGRCDKAAMHKAARERGFIGPDRLSEDEIDARLLLRYALEEIGT